MFMSNGTLQVKAVMNKTTHIINTFYTLQSLIKYILNVVIKSIRNFNLVMLKLKRTHTFIHFFLCQILHT